MRSLPTQRDKRFQTIKVSLPTDIHSEVMQHLYSKIEGRVPYGAWSRLVTNLLRVWSKSRSAITEKELDDLDDEDEDYPNI